MNSAWLISLVLSAIAPPQPLPAAPLAYPAAGNGVEAKVVLDIDIDAEGTVDRAAIVTPSAFAGRGFEEMALYGVLSHTFVPAKDNGVPVPVRVQYSIGFQPPAPDVIHTSALKGTVQIRGYRLPAAGIGVRAIRGDTTYRAQTDGNGEFQFSQLPAGDYTITISDAAFQPYSRQERLGDGEVVRVVYFVEKATNGSFELLVEASKLGREVSRIRVERQDINRIPGGFGDALTVVKMLPGVARTPLGNGSIIVRGSAPSATKVLIDSMEVPLVYHFGGLRSVVPTAFLDSVDFFPGNFREDYGRATGGIVDARIRRNFDPGIHGEIDVNLFDAGGNATYNKNNKYTLFLGGRRSYADGLIKALGSRIGNQTTPTVVPIYWDLQGGGAVRFNETHRLSFYGIGSQDTLEVLFKQPSDIARGKDLALNNGFYRLQLAYDATPNARFNNRLQLSQGRDRYDFSFGENLRFDLTSYTMQLRNRAAYQWKPWLNVSGGVDYLLSVTNLDVRLPPPPQEGTPSAGIANEDDVRVARVRNTAGNNVGLFVGSDTDLPGRVKMALGARVDRFGLSEQWRGAPRSSVRWQALQSLALKGAVGLYYQDPQPWELSKEFGNPALLPERAVQYALGFEYALPAWKFIDKLSLDITSYYKDLGNVVTKSGAYTVRDGQAVPENYTNDSVGRVVGADTVLRFAMFRQITGWLAYTVARSQRRDLNQGGYRLFDFDQTHFLTAVTMWRLPKNWEIGMRFRLVSGNPTTRVTGSTFVSADDGYLPIYGPINGARLPLFHQLDLRVTKRWDFQQWRLEAYLDIQNVYNRMAPESEIYNYNYTQRNYQRGLPIFPILGVKVIL